MTSPEPVLCINLFSPDSIDCLKVMPPVDRACGIRYIQRSDACPIKKVLSVATSPAVAILTICWWYHDLLLRNAVCSWQCECHSTSLFASWTFPFPGLTCKFGGLHQRLNQQLWAQITYDLWRLVRSCQELKYSTQSQLSEKGVVDTNIRNGSREKRPAAKSVPVLKNQRNRSRATFSRAVFRWVAKYKKERGVCCCSTRCRAVFLLFVFYFLVIMLRWCLTILN